LVQRAGNSENTKDSARAVRAALAQFRGVQINYREQSLIYCPKMAASTRSQTDNFKVIRSILTELVPKAEVGEVSRLMALAVHAGYNDFYLREADGKNIEQIASR
jgi:hypothetical protein